MNDAYLDELLAEQRKWIDHINKLDMRSAAINQKYAMLDQVVKLFDDIAHDDVASKKMLQLVVNTLHATDILDDEKLAELVE